MSLVELPLALPSFAAIAIAAPQEAGFAAQLRRAFGPDAAASAHVVPLAVAPLTLARLAGGEGGRRMVSLAAEDAWLATIELSPAPQASLRAAASPARPVNAGALDLFALEDGVDLLASDRPNSLLLHVPDLALRELAARHGAPRVDRLAPQSGASDPVVRHLALAIASSLGDGSPATSAPLRHAALALGARLAQRFGVVDQQRGAGPDALTPEQLRLAQTRLLADLRRAPDLAAIARACGLSPARFSAGFRRSTGLPPLAWLREQRLERAQAMLLQPGLSLAQIAYDCGFADQAHFTRAFAASIGTPPGAWRRAHAKQNNLIPNIQKEMAPLQYSFSSYK